MQRQQALSRDFCSFHEQSDASYRGIFSWLFGNTKLQKQIEELKKQIEELKKEKPVEQQALCKQEMKTLEQKTIKCQEHMATYAAKIETLNGKIKECELKIKTAEDAYEKAAQETPLWLTEAATVVEASRPGKPEEVDKRTA